MVAIIFSPTVLLFYILAKWPIKQGIKRKGGGSVTYSLCTNNNLLVYKLTNLEAELCNYFWVISASNRFYWDNFDLGYSVGEGYSSANIRGGVK